MGLFDKLFSKKEKTAKTPEKERITFDSPYCKFYYMNSPDSGEFGYEGDIKWVDKKNVLNQKVFIPDAELTVYFDTDTLESTETGLCYPLAEKYIIDKERTDSEVKRRAARYFMKKPELVDDDMTEETLIDYMELYWLGVYRNGDVVLGLDVVGADADDVHVIYKSDGSREIKYTDEDHEQEYCEPL